MVLNLTRPHTLTALPGNIPTRMERAVANSYDNGKDAGEAKFSGMSRDELHAEVKRMRKDIRGHEKQRAKTLAEYDRLTDLITTENELEFWAADFLTFQMPDSGAALSLRRAFLGGEVLSAHEVMAKMPVQNFEDIFEDGEIFRVEHDWFKAIRKANEFEGGSFRLPFETSIFEFQVSGKPVVAMCLNYAADVADNEIVMQFAIHGLLGWSLSHNLYRHNGGHWDVLQGGVSIKEDKLGRLVHLVGDQIRAACIALDAEVAAAELVRETHSGNGSLVEKDHPAYEFYTISLARKGRPEQLRSADGTKGARRLHFRRGHWRHYQNFKTWVRWCLVGNPELGFIDKQYRL